MIKLFVGVIAISRPEILALTLASFKHFCFDGFEEVRIIANVDPLGDADRTTTIKLLDSYDTSGRAIVNTPEISGFSKAVRWVWSNMPEEADWFLHLEDDWYLSKVIDPERIRLLFKDQNVGMARLFPHIAPLRTPIVSFNPMFIKRKVALEFSTLMNENDDPEYQAQKLWRAITPQQRIATACHPFTGRQVLDTGTLWRKARRIKKVLSTPLHIEGVKIFIWKPMGLTTNTILRFYGIRYRVKLLLCWISLFIHIVFNSRRPFRFFFQKIKVIRDRPKYR